MDGSKMPATAGKGVSARSRKAPRRTSARDTAFRSLLNHPEAVGMGSLMRAQGFTPAEALTPPGSLLDAVVRAIRNETDCPPELSLITTFAVLSAALCGARSTYSYYDDPNRRINPSVWIVALAESGAGKSFVRNVVAEALGIELSSIPTPASGPAYMDALNEVEGIGYLDADEYGQKLKQIAGDATMAPLKDALLQTFDHHTLTNRTRKHGLIEVKKPVLVIYGSTPDDSLGSCLNAEMLVDGFAARHLWAVTDPKVLSVFRYCPARIIDQISAHPLIGLLRETLKAQQHFIITEPAANELNRLFAETVAELGENLRRGFIRRITWSAGHYAVMYHLLTQNQPGANVGVFAVRWAWRMIQYHLYSTRRVLTLADPGFAQKLQRMTRWVDLQTREGVTTKQLERGFLQRFSRDLSSASEARQMLSICDVRSH